MKYQAIDPEYMKKMKEHDEFMRQKKDFYTGLKCGYWLTITILLLSAFLNGSMILAQSSNINFNFENAYAYDGLLPESTVLGNQRNTTELISSGNYSGTYSFENEVGLTNTNINIIDVIGNDYNAIIIPEYDNHNNVLLVNRSGTFEDYPYNIISVTEGTVEFWWNTNGTSLFCIGDDENRLINLVYDDSADYIRIYHASTYTTVNNIIGWAHVKTIFDCATDLQTVYINRIEIISDLAFYLSFDGIKASRIMFPATDFSIYDAIGYSWDKTRYIGTHFDVGTEDTNPTGITWDGTHFWVVGWENDRASQYTPEGVYTGTYFNIAQDTFPLGITWDDTYFWVIGNTNDEVYKYTDAGVYTGTHFDVGTEDINPCGITWDGTYFWVVGYNNDKAYKYYANGTYTEIYFNIGTQDNTPTDIIWNGNNFWVVGQQNDRVYEYTNEGVYTNTFFSVGTEEDYPRGITWDGTYFWVVGLTNDEVYKYKYIEFPYSIGDNLIAPLIETNVTETDKFEFTYDSSGNMNQIEDDNVSGFTDIENDFFSNDVVNVYDSIDDDLDKSIRIISAQLGECGIERDFNTDYINTSQVHWQLELSKMSYPESQIYTKIKNNDGDIIAWFKLEGATGYIPLHDKLADLYYYYNSEWVLIKANIGVRNNYNMTFELYWINGDDYGILGFDGTNYPILFENDQDSLGLFQIYAIADHNVIYITLDFRIDWVRIIVNGTSLSDELMPENVFILSGEPFSLLHQSFIEIIFDTTYENNVSIYLNDDILLMDNTYNTSTEAVFFRNLYQDKSYSGLYLKIYNSTDYNFESIKIYGIKLVSQQDSNNNAFLEFSYSEIDPNISYFYVYQNDLYYNLETDNNTELEYIQATFNINDLSSNGYSVAFSHQKGITDIESEARIGFTTDTYLTFISLSQITSVSLILPQNKIVNEIIFLITDDDNYILDTSKGYFSALTFTFYHDIETVITTLSLIEILPIILLLTVIPIAIYYGFGKKEELVVPSIIFISIFGTATGMIPLWLEVVILFSCLMFYIIKKKVI